MVFISYFISHQYKIIWRQLLFKYSCLLQIIFSPCQLGLQNTPNASLHRIMISNRLLVRLQFWSFRERGVLSDSFRPGAVVPDRVQSMGHRDIFGHSLYLKRNVIPWWVECSPMARETGVQSNVGSYQRLKNLYLIPLVLTLSIIRYRSRLKWSNTGKGVGPFPTSRCNSNWKGNFRVTLN